MPDSAINRFENPLIVQSDRTLLLDVHAPRAADCRNALIPFAELEAFGRVMTGFAPWFELPDDDTPEGRLRAAWRPRLLKAIRNAVDPSSPDFLVFAAPDPARGRQPLVDAAFFAQGLLRARTGVWEKLDPTTQRMVVDALVSSRVTKPGNNNWLLFAGEIEAFLLEVTGQCDMDRLRQGVDKFAHDWYVGEGYYSDGPHLAFDGYNSFVIHPMFYEIAAVMAKHGFKDGADYLALEKTLPDATLVSMSGIPETLRLIKDNPLIFTGLCARTAIRSGVPVYTAKKLESEWVGRIEAARSFSEAHRLRESMYNAFLRQVRQARESTGLSKAVRDCRSYIQANYMNEITLEDLARHCGYAEYYLSRKFAKETGMKISDYIHSVRIDAAKLLLVTTSREIQEISNLLHFGNRSHFDRVFRQHVGVSPAKFREQGGQIQMSKETT